MERPTVVTPVSLAPDVREGISVARLKAARGHAWDARFAEVSAAIPGVLR